MSYMSDAAGARGVLPMVVMGLVVVTGVALRVVRRDAAVRTATEAVAVQERIGYTEGVIAALQTVDAGTGAAALVHLAGPAGLEDVVLPSLVNDVAALPRPVVLVLDDYYLVANPVVHAAVTYLLDHQPDTLQIAIGTRARLSAKRSCACVERSVARR